MISKKTGIKKIQKEYRETPKHEIREAVIENFVFGFIGSIIVVFISMEIDVAVLLSYVAYYFFVGKVVNRPKYVTSLGRFIVFPASAAMSAFAGYKLAQFISPYLV